MDDVSPHVVPRGPRNQIHENQENPAFSGKAGFSGDFQGLAQENWVAVLAQTMSMGMKSTPETTCLRPDVLKRHFFGLAHPTPLLLRPFLSMFQQKCDNPGKS